MNGRVLTEQDARHLINRLYIKKLKGIPASSLGIKSWGIIDYMAKEMPLMLLKAPIRYDL